MVKKQIAFDKTFNVFIIIGTLFLYGSYIYFDEGSIGWGIGTCLIGLFFFVPTLILLPYLYIFDKDGITICYVFLKKERYLWKNIKSIEITNSGVSAGIRNAFADMIFFTVFEIKGRVEGEFRLHMNGHVRKGWRTKKLLEKYWDGKITGYFLEDIKGWFKKHKKKKQKDKNKKTRGRKNNG